MIQGWKIQNITKGMLTWLPALNAWRLHHPFTGGSDLPRYSYSVWLRHLVTLSRHGFNIAGAHVGELGPGDTLGVGLAALLSGARKYVGLDILPYSAKANLRVVFDELFQMYWNKERIPDVTEFPHARPRLNCYEFPNQLVHWENFSNRAEQIRSELAAGVNTGEFVNYHAPWTSPDNITAGSLDLVISQAVLEHVDALEETYRAMFSWLKPGGYASHVIDFSAHHLSPLKNGHWAYSDWEWRLVRGRREFLLNREPLSTHLSSAKKFGFEISLLEREYDSNGLETPALSRRFRQLDAEDARTCSAMLIMRKPSLNGGR